MATTVSSQSALPKVHTADQLWALPDDGFRYELVRGELRRSMATGHRHDKQAMRVAAPMAIFVDKHDLGEVYAAETGFRLADDHVRAPVVAFVTKDRVVEAGEEDGFWPGAPDLAVEVVSPSERYTDVEEKVFDRLDAGVRMVAVVNERRRTITVVRSRTEVRVLVEGDTLDGGDVVPGWQLPVADVFA